MNHSSLSQSIALPCRDSVRMPDKILVNITPQETRVSILEDNVVQELHIERAASRGIVGNIYLGKVRRVLPGMQPYAASATSTSNGTLGGGSGGARPYWRNGPTVRR